jgi:hypothetical protein
MNILILIANILALLTLIVHTFWGDRNLKVIEPKDTGVNKIEKWVMARGAFHIVSMDFLLATIGLTLINFTEVFKETQNLLLQILALYFFMYSIGFLIIVAISRQFPKNYLKLGQWILLLIISGLIYLGTN